MLAPLFSTRTKTQSLRRYSTKMAKYTSCKYIKYFGSFSYLTTARLVIIEQVNVAENDLNKIEYKTILGDKTFNEFILSHPSGKPKVENRCSRYLI